MKRTQMKRTARPRRVSVLSVMRRKPQAIETSSAAFHAAAARQIVCAVCGRGDAFHAHHVVAKGWLRQHARPLNDPRNALRLCMRCHMQHEFGGPGKVEIPLVKLPDHAICYAYGLMGIGASVYLERHYIGPDARIFTHNDEACPICQ